ncbi:c-type cytochrome [Castellaniella sp. GW247-6E4]|uniref:c-type cytochrome n=1 Tax=Castellaniella sp. GW247-6E4 TaxID=3140380 RepID=UPI003315FF09
MSHEENAAESHGHESVIKTPRQLLITVILAFLIPIVVIMMLVNLVGASIKTGAGSDSQTSEAIAKRIQPVAGFKLVDVNAPKVFKTGQQVFESTCSACHTSGVAGAPKFGDEAAWAPFIKQGYESLVKNAIHGIGAMPPKGGNASLDDFEVERAVVYMANHSGAKFDEPKEPAAEGGEAKAEAAPAAAPAQAAAAPAQAAAPAEAAPAAPQQQAAAAEPAAAASTNAVGEKIYKTYCFACHATGVAGAPKFGDKDAWAPFVKTGPEEMLKNAIKGVGAMPPRGGSQASDDEIKAAIEYMVDAAK